MSPARGTACGKRKIRKALVSYSDNGQPRCAQKASLKFPCQCETAGNGDLGVIVWVFAIEGEFTADTSFAGLFRRAVDASGPWRSVTSFRSHHALIRQICSTFAFSVTSS